MVFFARETLQTVGIGEGLQIALTLGYMLAADSDLLLQMTHVPQALALLQQTLLTAEKKE